MQTKILPWSKPKFASLPQCDIETYSPARSGRCKRVSKMRVVFESDVVKNVCSSHWRFRKCLNQFGKIVDIQAVYLYMRGK